LSAADILRYWSLLTPEQRAGFIEAHGPELSPSEQGADLVAKYRREVAADTLFDRFAGFFHGFGCLERAVTEALEEQNSKEADYRLFGRKYDSLGSLLDRIQSEGGQADPVDQYVVILCARQVCRRVAKEYPEYWKAHKGDTTELENRFAGLETVRSQLIETNGPEFAAFLDWFDQWFLKPAARFEMPDD
jgi:hypothetical protein